MSSRRQRTFFVSSSSIPLSYFQPKDSPAPVLPFAIWRRSIERITYCEGEPVTPRFPLFVALSLLIASLTAPATAQNLLVNPNFDTNLFGWQVGVVPGVSVSWNGALDADGSPASGSAKAVWQAA